MFYTDAQLAQLHETELEILREIIRVCTENDLRWFTVGGTTLGAVRHNGFIPWDDDIDIGMLRDDYERFLALAPQKLKKGFTLCHFSTQAATPTYFAKVRKDGTQFVEQAYRKLPIHQGIFVDVMPYDAVPEDDKKRRAYRRRVRIRWELFVCKTITTSSATANRKKQRLAAICRPVLHFLLKPIPKKRLFQMLDAALRCCNGTPTGMISSRGIDDCEGKLTSFFPLREHPFETLTVNIPADADSVLTAHYGDYRTLPPEDRRKTHAPMKLCFSKRESE